MVVGEIWGQSNIEANPLLSLLSCSSPLSPLLTLKQGQERLDFVYLRVATSG